MSRKTVIASVECDDTDKKRVEFDVSHKRTITLRFPNAVATYGYGGFSGTRQDFTRTLSPSEAREIGKALVDAADKVEGEA